MAFAVVGSLLGFLIFNHSPARIFMGDCGSLTLGFILSGVVVLGASKATTELIVALLVPVARVVSDQHWFSDVMAGLIIGTATAVVIARIHRDRAPSRYDHVMLGAATEERAS